MCKLNALCHAKKCDCAKWNAKLKAEGLDHFDYSVYDANGKIIPDLLRAGNKGSGKLQDEQKAINRRTAEEDMEERRDIVSTFKFATPQDRQIMSLHAEGDSVRKIATKLGSLQKSAISEAIVRITKAHRENCRKPVELTPKLIRDADPELLLDLLRII